MLAMEVKVERDASTNAVGWIDGFSWRAINRGILVAAIYVGGLLLAAEYALVGAGDSVAQAGHFMLFGIAGFVTAAVVGFGRAEDRISDKRELTENAKDTLVSILWLSVAVLAANLIVPFAYPKEAMLLIAALVGGALVGVPAGEPLLGLAGRLQIKGRRPFLFVNHITDSIGNADFRFVLRLILHSIVIAAVAALAVVAAIVVAICLGIWLLLSVLTESSSGGGAPSSSGAHSHSAACPATIGSGCEVRGRTRSASVTALGPSAVRAARSTVTGRSRSRSASS